MSGAMAFDQAYERRDAFQSSPSLCLLLLSSGGWMTMHIFATLMLAKYFTSSQADADDRKHRALLSLVVLMVFFEVLALLIWMYRLVRAYTTEIQTRKDSIGALRASLRSVTAERASRMRYPFQVPGTAGAAGPSEADSIAEKQLPQIPCKLVAHVDPDYLSEFDLEAAQSFSNNLEGMEERYLPVLEPQDQEAPESLATGVPAEQRDQQSSNTTCGIDVRPSRVQNGTLCAVCHNRFGPEGAHVLGTCGHVFHPSCLVAYSGVKRHC